MIRQPASLMDDTKKMLARALYDAGDNDTEIGLAIGLPAANVADWRRREGLPENRPAPSEAVLAYAARANPTPKAEAPAPATTPPPSAPPPTMPPPPFVPVPPPPPPPPSVNHAPRQTAPAGLTGAGVHPEGDDALEIGADGNGCPIYVDLSEMLVTRLLIQGNSGSGKSHLLRRIIEESKGIVQQIIIDPEGDFVTLAEAFGHTVIEAGTYSLAQLRTLGGRFREHRVSAVLNLEGGELADQMEQAAAFLDGLFGAAREHWANPVLVFVDEAQIFAPAHNAQLDVDSGTRAASVTAMANLMCRGRKRGLCGIIATQRLAKMHSNVTGEVSNFLMGRTFYDNDIARAADLLGLRKVDASQISDLERGQFIGVGSAISRKPLRVKVGDTFTRSPHAPPAITPLPDISEDALKGLLDVPPDQDEASAEPAIRPMRLASSNE